MTIGREYLEGRAKRWLDYSLASGLLFSSSPLWVAIYLYNQQRNQPLFFKQERMGKGLKHFKIVKFETLHSGAELEGEHDKRFHLAQSLREESDPRVPNRVMGFLRKTGLNELPQTLNILKGDMSIVCPRPLPKDFIDKASNKFPDVVKQWEQVVCEVKPGLIGVAPLKTRRLPVEQFNILAAADINYCKKATFFLDLTIIAEAFVSVVAGK